MKYLNLLGREFKGSLGSYYCITYGEVTDARPELAKKWVETMMDFDPSMIEPNDLAAIMSCCVILDPDVGKDLISCFANADESDVRAIGRAIEEGFEIIDLDTFTFKREHPARAYFEKLFESDDGRDLLF